MFKVTVGHSCDPDSESAISEVIKSCQADLDGLSPCAGILMGACDYDHQLLLDQLDTVFPNLELIGGTTNGELSSKAGFNQDSLVLVLFCSDTVEIRAGVGYQVDSTPQEAASQAVQIAQEHLTQNIQLCLICPDGLTANGSHVIDALQRVLPEQTPIVGGMTGENLTYKTDYLYQYYKKQVLQNTVPILLFSGDFHFSFGVGCGFQPIGAKGKVTRVTGNKIHEIDHQPAEHFFRKYWNDLQLNLQNLGLAVFEEKGDKHFFRSIQKYDRETMDITAFGDVPQHSIVQLTQATRSEILEGTYTSISNAIASYSGKHPEALLCFSCGTRRLSLSKMVKKEYEIAQSKLPIDLSIAGWYVYGEFSPLKKRGKTYFHNLTFVSLLLGT